MTRRTEASSAFEEVIRTLGNIAAERPPMICMTLPLKFSLWIQFLIAKSNFDQYKLHQFM